MKTLDRKSIGSDYRFGRTKSAVTVLNAMGWKEGLVNPEAVSMDSVFFYVFDHDSEWMWCCSIPRDAFYEAPGHADVGINDAVVSCCSATISECIKAEPLRTELEGDLALSLILYVKMTRIYAMTDKATKANHFVVVRYGGDDWLRPFALRGSPSHMNPVNVVMGSIQQVVALDRVNHPEWFARSSRPKG